jgi:hypothetical protein
VHGDLGRARSGAPRHDPRARSWEHSRIHDARIRVGERRLVGAVAGARTRIQGARPRAMSCASPRIFHASLLGVSEAPSTRSRATLAADGSASKFRVERAKRPEAGPECWRRRRRTLSAAPLRSHGVSREGRATISLANGDVDGDGVRGIPCRPPFSEHPTCCHREW